MDASASSAASTSAAPLAPLTPMYAWNFYLCLLLPRLQRFATRAYMSSRRQAFVVQRPDTVFSASLVAQSRILAFVNNFRNSYYFTDQNILFLASLLVTPFTTHPITPLRHAARLLSDPSSCQVVYIARALGITGDIFEPRVSRARYVLSITILTANRTLQMVELARALLHMGTMYARLNTQDLFAELVGLTFQQREDRLVALAFYDRTFEESFTRAIHLSQNHQNFFSMSFTSAGLRFPVYLHPAPPHQPSDTTVRLWYDETRHLALW